MNRLKMEEEIARCVPKLAERGGEELKQAEKLRRQFVLDFPLRRINGLALDDYVIGKVAGKGSFCYRLEREMDSLGTILGATAFKFGVYFGRIKSDPTDKYRFRPHWGKTLNQAFVAVKQAIVDLLAAADQNDFAAIAQNKLSPMFKGKILFLYHHNQYAPIYARQYLQHFVTALHLEDNFECEADMQRALMRYRNKWQALRNQHPVLYQRFLYEVFGDPKYSKSSGPAAPIIPLLKTAMEGAQFISQMPASPPAAGNQTAGHGKTDYEARQKHSKRTGDRGELIVRDLERKRLIQAGKLKLAKQIDHVADRKDGLGYDILSFDENGTERPIEVKATSASNLQNGFYISANELGKSAEIANFHLYLVFSALSKAPRVFVIKEPNLKGKGFVLQPLNYLVTLSKKV
jgi:hypothetical protein